MSRIEDAFREIRAMERGSPLGHRIGETVMATKNDKFAHPRTYQGFRDLAAAKLPGGREPKAYFIVMIDESGTIYSGAVNAEQCIPEAERMIAYWGERFGIANDR